MKTIYAGLAALQCLVASSAWAQSPQPSTSPPAHPVLTQSDNARLMRIDEGIFELQVGRTVDLTDKKIMIMIEAIQNAEDPARARVVIRYPGNTVGFEIGRRWNLKNTFSDTLREYRECFIDIVRVVAPRGAPASATLRMECA